jgi:DHA1 family bicyclomycin/chloramphenicol resistance-like MFS transporter
MTAPRLSRLQLSASSALSPFAMVVIAPLLPDLARSFRADPREVQFVLSAYLLGLTVAQLVLGPISDRFGRRPVLIASLLAYAVLSLVCAAAPSLPVLIAARFLQACAAAGTAAICRASVHDVHRGEAAAHYLAYIAAANSISNTLAPMVGGFVGAVTGWRGLFVGLAFIGLAMAAYTARAMPETRTATAATRFGIGHVLRTNALMLRRPLFLCYALIYGLTGAPYYGFLAVAPGHFAAHFGIGGAVFGMSWSLMAAAFLVGALISARAVKRIGQDRLTDAALIGSALAAAAMPAGVLILGASPATLIAPLVALSLTLGVSSPLLLSAAIGLEPSLAGTASGLIGAMAMGSSALVTPVAALVYDGGALSLTWPVVACVTAMALLRFAARRLESRSD